MEFPFPSDLIFYVPPYFVKESRQRNVLRTPFVQDSVKTEDPFKGTSFSLNKPIDFQTQVAKNYIAPYLQQPTSQDDRIKLLFESLKKQNLI